MQSIINEEVDKKVGEELDRRSQFEENMRSSMVKEGKDLEVQALRTWAEMRNKIKVDFDNVTDEDALADAMKCADTLKTKKMLMRYKRLKAECMAKDPVFTNKVLRNYFTLIRKVGPLWKRGGKIVGTWQQRFVVLTNAGLVYFKVDEMRKEEDLEPQNFKPLNDFAIQEI